MPGAPGRLGRWESCGAVSAGDSLPSAGLCRSFPSLPLGAWIQSFLCAFPVLNGVKIALRSAGTSVRDRAPSRCRETGGLDARPDKVGGGTRPWPDPAPRLGEAAGRHQLAGFPRTYSCHSYRPEVTVDWSANCSNVRVGGSNRIPGGQQRGSHG